MRFHVIRTDTERLGDRLENAELIGHCVKYLIRHDRQFFATEILAIEKARMRTNGDAVIARCWNRLTHCVRVAGVKTAGNARGRNEFQQLGIMPSAFAQIGVKIDTQIHESRRLSPTRKRSSSLLRSSKSRCAFAIKTSEKRTWPPARSCAAMLRSTVITCAIFG